MKWRAYYSLNGEEKAAVYLKDLLTELGPAFVKIGQAVSSRPDVVPPVYIKQLEFLQVPSDPHTLLQSEHVYAQAECSSWPGGLI